MRQADMVTDFKLIDAEGNTPRILDLVKAIEAHCSGLLDGERFSVPCQWYPEHMEDRLPARYAALVAYTMDGQCEGYYVHLGAVVDFGDGHGGSGVYVDLAFVKLWNPDAARKLADEAQRFLCAARWN